MRLTKRRALTVSLALALMVSICGPVRAASDDQRPSKPTGIRECATDYYGEVPMCWTPSTDDTGVTGYDIYQIAGDTIGRIGTSPIPAYTATRLLPDLVHKFFIVARDAAGNMSAWSDVYMAYARPGVPVPYCHVEHATGRSGDLAYASIGLTNTGTTPINGWRLFFAFPGDQRIRFAWGAHWVQDGAFVTLSDAARTIAPAETISAGYAWPYSSAYSRPSWFSIDGAPCKVTYVP
ncbi:hypothetical protein DP939_36050 [Spongiactinospora rosea]|uniref:CBM2 domain-containing protein n=1 Tax=Spongiactinospora rosea TaxID=2248750 RepID=A0A366LPD6_9ACTN|nr:cellulose binding domain-containing protein [Spongiactinospora rosea]RBQ15259.1 hypothetical protein DP939_36050 [Spongiactinospora rosea]